MNRKKKVFLLLLCILILCSCFCGCEKNASVITDSSGNRIAQIVSMDAAGLKVTESTLRSAVEIAFDEAVDILCRKQNISKKDAKTALTKKGYKIQTSLMPEYCFKIEGTYVNNLNDTDSGCVIIEPTGKILAANSKNFSKSDTNFALENHAPCSAFKPLSVYAPLVDKGIYHYSEMIEDSPVSTVDDYHGAKREWPNNASGKYSRRPVTLETAIKESLNTAAVRSLQKLGIKNAVEFLTENFEINLESEQKHLAYGETEDLLGAIALGSTAAGCNPLQMAGYYEMFANGGTYTKPYCVLSILDRNGKEIYRAEPQTKRVIKETTAWIMNRLLNAVVSHAGTGKLAYINQISVGGKTGTNDNNQDNWFVGFTPQYVCAVWHGEGEGQNIAPFLFSKILTAIGCDKSLQYPACNEVLQRPYCDKTGLLSSPRCQHQLHGYYAKENVPGICTKCHFAQD